MNMMFVVRGLPGSGKSTLAQTMSKAMHIRHFEADQFLYTEEGEYVWSPKRLGWAIRQCQRHTEHEMQNGHDVIVAGVFANNKALRPYKRLADTYGYAVTYIVVENRHEGQNIHDVPPETLEDMRKAFTVQL